MSNRLKSRRRRSISRRAGGASLAEFAAALILLLPLLITVCLVAFEASQVYMIKSALQYCANMAARQLAIAYGQNPTGTIGNESTTYSNIRYLGVVKSNNQFSVPAGTAGWNTTGTPPTVTVQVTFTGGQNGCPPLSPDPLGLGGGFTAQSSATARLE